MKGTLRDSNKSARDWGSTWSWWLLSAEDNGLLPVTSLPSTSSRSAKTGVPGPGTRSHHRLRRRFHWIAAKALIPDRAIAIRRAAEFPFGFKACKTRPRKSVSGDARKLKSFPPCSHHTHVLIRIA